MKPGAMLINTSRGAVIDTVAAICGLKSGRISAPGMDVDEEEGDLVVDDLSNRIIPDDVFARLRTFPNVLVMGHRAFFTDAALGEIARTTPGDIAAFAADGAPLHPVAAGPGRAMGDALAAAAPIATVLVAMGRCGCRRRRARSGSRSPPCWRRGRFPCRWLSRPAFRVRRRVCSAF